jgi:hypothetical protein
MIRRIIVTAILGGALVLAPTAAYADKKGNDDNKSAHQSDGNRDGGHSDNNGHEGHDRHESGHVDRGDGHNDHDRSGYRDPRRGASLMGVPWWAEPENCPRRALCTECQLLVP